MPAALTPRSAWRVLRLLSLLLPAGLAGALADESVAQEGGLQLRHDTQLGARPNAPISEPSAPEAMQLRLERNIGVTPNAPPLAPTSPQPGSQPEGLRAIPAIPAGKVTEALLLTDVNQQGLDEAVVFLIRDDGTVLIAGEDLDRWRLRRPNTPPYEYGGKLFYPVTDLPWLKVQINQRAQSIAITAEPGAFAGTAGTVAAQRYVPPIKPQPGGFFNYTISGTHTEGLTTTNGLFEAGFFSEKGVLTSSLLMQDVADSSSWLRLETTYAMDFPDKLTSARLGDTITVPGSWGRAVRIGGAQYGTNFALQPNFVRTPFMRAAGTATVPSTVDVFVNNALVQRNTVPPGPFSVQNIPVVTGSGEVRVVVRDLLGREQVITQPFYSSATLLKAGLSDYSYEVGEIRNNFGVESNDYGPAAGSATYRRGLSDYLTGEIRGEASRDLAAVGASGALRLANFGVVSLTGASSKSDAGSGQLLGSGIEHLTSTFSASLQAQVTTPEFRQLGMQPGELPRRQQTSGTIAYAMGPAGSITGSYAIQQFRDQPQAKVGTVTYAVPVGKRSNLSFGLISAHGLGTQTTAFAALTISFDELTTGNVNFDRVHDSTTGATTRDRTLVLQRSLPLGEGYGYRLQAHNEDFLGSYSQQTGFGTYTVEASQPKDGPGSQRVTASGGVGLVGGHAFLARTLTDSFGVVRVADYPDVHVLQDNHVVARTDAQGYAVLPRMRPYDRNQVSIEQNDLPLDATFDQLRLEAAPYFRSGVLLDFPVHRVRAGTLHVRLEDGTPLPSGALAMFEGGTKEFPVALGGEAYLEGFRDANRIVFTWRGQSCTLDVAYPKTTDLLPELGTFVCTGVKP